MSQLKSKLNPRKYLRIYKKTRCGERGNQSLHSKLRPRAFLVCQSSHPSPRKGSHPRFSDTACNMVKKKDNRSPKVVRDLDEVPVRFASMSQPPAGLPSSQSSLDIFYFLIACKPHITDYWSNGPLPAEGKRERTIS